MHAWALLVLCAETPFCQTKKKKTKRRVDETVAVL